jgi:hypothetical protein
MKYLEKTKNYKNLNVFYSLNFVYKSLSWVGTRDNFFSYRTCSDVLGNNTCQSNIYANQKRNIIIVRSIAAIGHLESFWISKLTLGIANQIPIKEKYCNNNDNFSEVCPNIFIIGQ